MAGLPIMGPATLCGLSDAATAMACIATVVAPATALVIALLLTPCNESCLYDDKTYWCF